MCARGATLSSWLEINGSKNEPPRTHATSFFVVVVVVIASLRYVLSVVKCRSFGGSGNRRLAVAGRGEAGDERRIPSGSVGEGREEGGSKKVDARGTHCGKR